MIQRTYLGFQKQVLVTSLAIQRGSFKFLISRSVSKTTLASSAYSTFVRLSPNIDIEVTSAEIMCIFPHAGEPLHVSEHGDRP